MRRLIRWTMLTILPFTGTAYADCFEDAAAYQHLNANVLRALAWQESRNQPNSLRHNTNGSIDYGVMQINSVHLPELSRYGIDRTTLLDPCKSVYIAAWHLRRQVLKYGETWKAVGAYHSETPVLRDQYATQVRHILERWTREGLIIDATGSTTAHWPSGVRRENSTDHP
jgi:lysozyme-related protein Hpa2